MSGGEFSSDIMDVARDWAYSQIDRNALNALDQWRRAEKLQSAIHAAYLKFAE